MPANDSFSRPDPTRNRNQSDLVFRRVLVSEVAPEEELSEDAGTNWGLGLAPEQEERARWIDELDVLCLESACVGVLWGLWCELTTYADGYAVPKSALRAMVECAFLGELDKKTPFLEYEYDP